MLNQRSWWEDAAWTGVAAIATTFVVQATGCSAGDHRAPPAGKNPSAPFGAGGERAADTHSCVEDDVRACKVQIDERNCFVGVQRCQDGVWAECVEPDKLDAAAQTSGDCSNNPCNPYCQVFEEVPPGGLTASAGALPSGGTIHGLPSSWQNAGLNDIDHQHAAPCTSAGACQFDTYCDESICNANGCGKCVPWGPGEHGPSGYSFGGAADEPNLTIPVVCGSATAVTVCNRGGVPTSGTIHVQMSNASATNFDSCNGFSLQPPGNSCTSDEVILPGQCIEVTGCDLSGTHTITVNQSDHPPTLSGPAESYCDDNWSLTQPSLVCSCTQATTTATLSPLTMFFMLDNSASMQSQGLWGAAKAAAKAFIQSPDADRINFSIRMYGSDGGADCEAAACSAANCADFAYGPQQLSNTAYEASLVAFINGASTGGAGTPHFAAMAGLTSRAQAFAMANPSHKTVAVYISDGDHPVSCNGPRSIPAIAGHAATAFASNPSVETFTVALQGASLGLLDAIAQAGGQNGAIDLTSSSDLQADMGAALTSIRGSALSCHVQIPNAGQLDLAQFVVEHVDSVGDHTTLDEVADASGCVPGGNQYYLDASQTEVVVCDELCDAIRADDGHLDLSGGCAGSYGSESYTFTYEADCTGFVGAGPQWDFLAYDTTVVGDGGVTWEVRTASSEGALATASWVVAGVSSSGAEDAHISVDPRDLGAALGVSASLAPWLEMRVTLSPTSGGTASPTVHDFQLYFSCLENQ